jgi:hypothetical protein
MNRISPGLEEKANHLAMRGSKDSSGVVDASDQPSAVFSAVLAPAVDLESMPRSFVMVLAPNLVLQAVHFRGKELNRAPAFGANHVVVAAAVVLVLVAGNPVMKRYFTGQSTLCKELEGAIDGGKSNAWIALAYQLVKLFGRKMLVSFEERQQDGIALFGLLQTYSFQVLMETVLGLAKRFPRDRDVIINTLLEHRRIGLRAVFQHNISDF